MDKLLTNELEWFISLAVAAATIVTALILHPVLFAVLRRLGRRRRYSWLNSFVLHFRRVSLAVFLLFALQLALPLFRIAPPWAGYLSRFLHLVWMVVMFWAARQGLRMLEDFLVSRFDLSVADNLESRKMLTQIQVLKKVVYVILGIVAGAMLLMSFKGGQKLGASLLASAGVAGLVIGVAAQRTLGNMLAGIQIALTQPIRLDDVVVVEGEWGRIEDITLTYVVVRIWDLRRLILPISYFIEKPFQNWTRSSANILGTVFLTLDYSVPMEELRAEYKRILDGAEQWDGKVWNIQITDSTDKAVQVRLLMSARDSGSAWDLRCFVREKMIAYLQNTHPLALPRLRAELGARDAKGMPAALPETSEK